MGELEGALASSRGNGGFATGLASRLGLLHYSGELGCFLWLVCVGVSWRCFPRGSAAAVVTRTGSSSRNYLVSRISYLVSRISHPLSLNLVPRISHLVPPESKQETGDVRTDPASRHDDDDENGRPETAAAPFGVVCFPTTSRWLELAHTAKLDRVPPTPPPPVAEPGAHRRARARACDATVHATTPRDVTTSRAQWGDPSGFSRAAHAHGNRGGGACFATCVRLEVSVSVGVM